LNGYILDASVAAKWFLRGAAEGLIEQSTALLRDYIGGKVTLAVPDLFWPEFGNILWKATKQTRVSLQHAAEAIKLLRTYGLLSYPTEMLIEDAFSIAAKFDRSVYDSVYVALAILQNMPLITADERLVSSLSPHVPVMWLGRYPNA
jgi:predicted nucleic acid-binding protein